MADYIARQEAIAYAISGSVRTLPTSEDGEDWIRTSEVRQSLLTMPSAEPQRPKGEWLEKYAEDGSDLTRHRFYCSACGSWQTYGRTNFCPNCGSYNGGE